MSLNQLSNIPQDAANIVKSAFYGVCGTVASPLSAVTAGLFPTLNREAGQVRCLNNILAIPYERASLTLNDSAFKTHTYIRENKYLSLLKVVNKFVSPLKGTNGELGQRVLNLLSTPLRTVAAAIDLVAGVALAAVSLVMSAVSDVLSAVGLIDGDRWTFNGLNREARSLLSENPLAELLDGLRHVIYPWQKTA